MVALRDNKPKRKGGKRKNAEPEPVRPKQPDPTPEQLQEFYHQNGQFHRKLIKSIAKGF